METRTPGHFTVELWSDGIWRVVDVDTGIVVFVHLALWRALWAARRYARHAKEHDK